MDNDVKRDLKGCYYYKKMPDNQTEWNQFKEIYHYMKLDYFFALLFSKKYYISARNKFDDKNEKSLPLIETLGFSVVGIDVPKEQIEEDYKRREERRQKYKDLGFLPTTCWTYNDDESSLMWDAYTSEFGVRIKTNINAFLDNLNYDGYEVYCGYMHYHGYKNNKDHIDDLFSKSSLYADEKEFRFYFNPIDKEIEKSVKKQGHIKLNISSVSDMITEVSLSPSIRNNHDIKCFVKWVCDYYHINV